MVMAALAAVKQGYNGIPFAKDLADARAMAAAWRSAGTVAVVDAFMQAVPAIVHMKAMIAAGWIGEVFGADVAFEVPLFSVAQTNVRSEELTSELPSLMRISYAVFCLKTKNTPT